MKNALIALAIMALPAASVSSAFVSPSAAAATVTALGDLSSFRAIVADAQTIAAKGDFAAAQKRITDFETAWDKAHKAMRPLNTHFWSNIDVAADAALDALRAPSPEAKSVAAALSKLLAELDNPAL
jgi:hypothetical protein